MTKKELQKIDAIRKVLSRQTFADFYKDGGEYDQHFEKHLDAGSFKEREKLNEKMNERIFLLFEDVIKIK